VKMRTFIKKLSIVDHLYFFTLAIVFLFYLVAFKETPYKRAVPLVFLGLIAMLATMIHLRGKNSLGNWQPVLSVLYAAVFITGIFETFFMIISYFNSARYDELMAAIDLWILGVNPTIWFEHFVHPVVTELFYILYIIYFPMPFFIIAWLFRKKKFKELAEAIFILSFTYLGADLIYFLVPVQGPRFFLKHLQTVPLDGIVLAEPIRDLINFFEPNKLDAFPSLHTSIVLTVLVLCYRHNRRLFHVFVPISAGILISLVYCRYHYFIDMVAGAVWFVFAYYTSVALFKKFNPGCYPHFGKEIMEKEEP